MIVKQNQNGSRTKQKKASTKHDNRYESDRGQRIAMRDGSYFSDGFKFSRKVNNGWGKDDPYELISKVMENNPNWREYSNHPKRYRK